MGVRTRANAQLLRLTFDGQIEFFRAELDVAAARDANVLSVEHHVLGAHRAIHHAELSDSATDLGALLVLLQQQAEATRHVDASQLRECGAHFTVRKNRIDAPIRSGHHIVNGIAVACEHRARLHGPPSGGVASGALPLSWSS